MGTQNDEDEGFETLAPGTVVDDRYRVVRFIGAGGSGAVYEVEHTMTGRRLALKCLLDESSYGRLEQEARAASVMKSPHAVKVTDMGRKGPTGPYLVMELLEGQSLRELLDDTGQLPLELTVNVALQVCECLAEAHAHGIIHRDLKPENVFLCEAVAGGYDVKVLDFGVVKVQGDGPIPHSSLTRTGSTVGTPYYMSLEQLRNSSAVDARADVYALGVVMYESLSGNKPYQAETLGDLVYALAVGPPPPLARIRPDLPGPLCDVVMRALSSNREQRPPSMTAFAEAIASYGDPALGVWLRRGGAPSGVRPMAPPKPVGAPRPAAGRAPQDARTGPLPAQPAELDDTELAPPSPPRRAGDRDTPTEMYVKAVHAPEEVRGRDTPTQAFDTTAHHGAPPPAGDEGDADMTREVVALMGPALPFPGGGPAGDASGRFDAAAFRAEPGAPAAGIAPPPIPPLAGPAPISSTYAHPRSNAGLALAATQPVPRAPLPVRPAWQEKLDASLRAVGDFLERHVTRASRAFRSASPQTQIVLVMCAASVAAALLVLLLYLILR